MLTGEDRQDDRLVQAIVLMQEAQALLDGLGAARAATHLQHALDTIGLDIQADLLPIRH